MHAGQKAQMYMRYTCTSTHIFSGLTGGNRRENMYISPVVFSNYSNKKGRYASDVKLFSYDLLPCPQAFSEICLFVKINNSRRAAREGWPLLTLETEPNGDSKSTNERSPPWLVRWACRARTRDLCTALTALVGPVQNILFLTIHYFSSFVLFDQQAGQAVVLGCLSLNICLRVAIREKNKAKPTHPRMTTKLSVYGSVCPLLKLRGRDGGGRNGVGV